MSCFSCFSLNEKRAARRSDKNNNNRRVDQLPGHASVPHKESTRPENPKTKNPAHNDTTNRGRKSNNTNDENIAAQTFIFRELATATKNFRKDCLIGEGGFGRVYKGKLDRSGQVVAVKQLDQNGMQGHKEFLVEVLMLSLLHDQHLVNLIGYCADGEQRLLVYEYMPFGSLEGHLLDRQPGQKPLDWNTRMKIALGAARGLEYLHDKANPPVIYRDLKSSNILLDSDFNAKLSDFGLAKLGPVGDKTHVSSRIMGTYGYCAPEYQRTGHLTVKSDVYSYGVVLLEIITGRRAVDTTKTGKKQYLVNWAQPIFKDPNRIAELADPLLQGTFPTRGLHQAVAVATMCLNDAPASRPSISDVVSALSFLGGSAEKGNAKDPTLPDDYAMARGGDGINASEREVAEAAGRGSTSRRPVAQQENAPKMITM